MAIQLRFKDRKCVLSEKEKEKERVKALKLGLCLTCLWGLHGFMWTNDVILAALPLAQSFSSGKSLWCARLKISYASNTPDMSSVQLCSDACWLQVRSGELHDWQTEEAVNPKTCWLLVQRFSLCWFVVVKINTIWCWHSFILKVTSCF